MSMTVAQLKAIFTADITDVEHGLTTVEQAALKTGKKAGDNVEQGLTAGARSAGERAGSLIDRGVLGRTSSTGKKAGDTISDGVTSGARAAGERAGSEIDKGLLSRLRGQNFGEMLAKGVTSDSMKVAGGAAGAGLVFGLHGAMSRADARGMLQAQLGASGKEAAKYGKVAGDLWKGAWGDSLADTGGTVRAVVANMSGMRQASAKELSAVATNVLAIKSAFGEDETAITRAADRMVSSGMAKNAKAALDVITYGMQHGANSSEDLLDTFTEYPTQFRKLGINGAQALGLIRQGLKGGARDSDIVADSLKEFSIRAVNGSKLTSQGFKALGLDGQKMGEQVGKGGESANQALQLTLDRIRAIDDPVKRAQAATALFGTQWEDLGGALLRMDPSKAATSMDKITGSAKRAGDSLSGPSARITEFKRTLQSNLVDFVDQKVIPAGKKLEQAREWFDGLSAGEQDLVKWGAGSAAALGGTLIAAKKLADVYSSLRQSASVLSGGRIGGAGPGGFKAGPSTVGEMMVRAGVVNVTGGGRGVPGAPGSSTPTGRPTGRTRSDGSTVVTPPGRRPPGAKLGKGGTAAVAAATVLSGFDVYETAREGRSGFKGADRALKGGTLAQQRAALDKLQRDGRVASPLKTLNPFPVLKSAAQLDIGGVVKNNPANRAAGEIGRAGNFYAGGGSKKVRELQEEILGTKKALLGLPSDVITKITAPGARVTTQDVVALAKEYHATPKQVATLMQATGVDDQRSKVAKYLTGLGLAPDVVNTVLNADTSKGTGPLREYLRSLGLTPGRVDTVVRALTSGAKGDIASVLARLGVLGNYTATPKVRVIDNASGTIHAIQSTMRGLDGSVATTYVRTVKSGGTTSTAKFATRADGGWISGPGGPREDKIPAMLSNGEFVVNAAASARHGHLLEQLNRNRYADGGRVGGGTATGGTPGLASLSGADLSRLTRAWLDAAQASMATAQAAKATTQSQLDDINGQKQIADLQGKLAEKTDNSKQIASLVTSLNNRDKKGRLTTTGVQRTQKSKELAAARASNGQYVLGGVDRQAAALELQKAREDLVALRASAAAAGLSDAGTSIRDRVLDRSGIFGGGALTAKQLLKNLRSDAVTNEQFQGIVAQLGTRGLSQDLLDQFRKEGASKASLALGKSILATGNIADLNQVQSTIGIQAQQAGYASQGVRAPGDAGRLVNIEAYYANDKTVDEIAEDLNFKSQLRGTP